MWWLLLLAIPPLLVTGLYFLPIRIKANYDDGGLIAKLFLGPLKFHLYPDDDDEDKLEFEAVGRSSSQQGKTKAGTSTARGSYEEFLAYVRFFVDILNDLRQKITVRNLRFKMILAGADPYDIAMKYGRAWTAVGNAAALLEQAFTIKKRELSVDSDFLAGQTYVVAELDISIILGRFIRLYVTFAKRYYTEFNKILIIKKGGANK